MEILSKRRNFGLFAFSGVDVYVLMYHYFIAGSLVLGQLIKLINIKNKF